MNLTLDNDSSTLPMYVLLNLNDSSFRPEPGIYHVGDDSLVADHTFPGMTNTTSRFNYSPLAVMNPPGPTSEQVYIYHQINESAFGEETWDGDNNLWTSTTIGVETSQ